MTAVQARRVEVNLGHLCNNRCVFCMSGMQRDAKSPWARPEAVKAELERYYAQGCRHLGFLGGEPTVYPRLLDCMDYARRLGYTRIALCTNGTRLADARFCRALVDAGLTRVAVSVHSHRDDLEDALITRVPGNLAKKVAGIRNMVALRDAGRLADNVSLNPVLCRPTLPLMEEYLAFFSKLGIGDVRFNLIWPEGDVREDPAWIPTLREAVPAVVRLLLLNERRLRLRLTFGGVPRCALRFAAVSPALASYLADKYLDELAYDPANDVTLPGGGGAGGEQRFVWQDQKRDALKTRAPACADCGFSRGCDGVWKTYAALHGLGELRALPASPPAGGRA